MTKDRKKVKELNLILDRVVTHLNASAGVVAQNLRDAAKAVSIASFANRSDIEDRLAKLRAAVFLFQSHLDTQDVAGRPLVQRADGLYFTGEDR